MWHWCGGFTIRNATTKLKEVKKANTMASAKDTAIPDALSALEMAMRPHSVPSWLASDSVHAPKVTTLGPRRPAAEYIDPDPVSLPFEGGSILGPTSASTTSAGSTYNSKTTYRPAATAATATPTTLLSSSVRPHAPIGIQKETITENRDNVSGLPKRNRRTAQQDLKSRRVKQSVSESLQSLHLFDKTANRSRELCTTACLLRTFDDPEGNVHFVNIDEEDLEQVTRMPPSHNQIQCQNPVSMSSSPEDHHKPAHSGPSSDVVFQIPELPKGKQLVFNVLSTWGDPFYVGLMGIEIFDHTGHAAFLSDIDRQLAADPADLNTLNTQSSDATSNTSWDPRTVDKLVDGHYFTCDELHAWVAPFTRGQNHFIYFDLDENTCISMIRIWNYNTTRIHSYRGARYVEITLDGKFIFKGEIRRAPGSVLEGIESCHECILFTTNLSILKVIEKYDKVIRMTSQLAIGDSAHGAGAGDENDTALASLSTMERPSTADRDTRARRKLDSHKMFKSPSVSFCDNDPFRPDYLERDFCSEAPSKLTCMRPTTAPISSEPVGRQKPVVCKRLSIAIEANWGDPLEVGITGIQFLDPNGLPIQLDPENVVKCPSSHEKLQLLMSELSDACRSIGAEEMWCVPLKSCVTARPNENNYESKSITVEFNHPTVLSGLKIWNYNLSLEDSFKGVKFISIFCDGKICPVKKNQSVLVRKAPGNDLIDFAQTIPLMRWNCEDTGDVEAGAAARMRNRSTRTENTDKSDTADHQQKESDITGIKDTCKDATFSRANAVMPHRHMKPIFEVAQQYQTPLFPTGCIIKFVFLSTWGDRFYLGLNGVELYDEHNLRIALADNNVDARPRDINVLRENHTDSDDEKDVRTLDKLYDGINNTYDDRHMWLTPFTPNQCNYLFFYFDSLVTLSKVLVWNYSKTPDRGVKEYEIFMDDALIYHGIMKKAPPLDQEHQDQLASVYLSAVQVRTGGTPVAASEVDMCECILFTDDPAVVENELDHIYLPEEELEESVTFFCDGQVLSLTEAPERETLIRPKTKAGSGLTGGRRAPIK